MICDQNQEDLQKTGSVGMDFVTPKCTKSTSVFLALPAYILRSNSSSKVHSYCVVVCVVLQNPNYKSTARRARSEGFYHLTAPEEFFENFGTSGGFTHVCSYAYVCVSVDVYAHINKCMCVCKS